MASSRATLEISEAFFKTLDLELAQLEAVSRMKEVKAGMRKAVQVVKKRYRDLLPRPGYPGDKPGLKAVRDTIEVKVKEYGNGKVVAVVGAGYPAGAHAHLLEEGHEKVLWGRRVGGFVEGRKYLERAVKSTEQQVEQVILWSVQDAIEKAKAKTA